MSARWGWVVLCLVGCGGSPSEEPDGNAGGGGTAPGSGGSTMSGGSSGSGGSGSTGGVATGGAAGAASGGSAGAASGGSAGAPSNATVYARADMEDGTLGDFVAAGNKSNLGSNYIHIVDDPTGHLTGKVARIHYLRNDTVSSKDRNNSFDWLPSAAQAIGLGQTVYVRGTFVMPTPAAGLEATQRKLFYWQIPTNQTSHFVIKYEDDRIVAALYTGAQGHRLFKTMVGPSIFAQPHKLEVLVTVNSSTTQADGKLQIWLDGKEVVNASDVLFQDTTDKWVRFKVGQQVNVSFASETFDEYRYWDDVVIADSRIP